MISNLEVAGVWREARRHLNTSLRAGTKQGGPALLLWLSEETHYV